MPKKSKSKQIEAKAINQNPSQNYWDNYSSSFNSNPDKNKNLKIQTSTDPVKDDEYIKSAVQVPRFWTYWNYYQIFDEVVSCIDLITKITTNLGLKFYNQDKEEVELNWTDKLADGYNTFNELFCQNILIHGQAMPTIFENSNQQIYLRNIPIHQVSIYQTRAFGIDNFWWMYSGELVNKQIKSGSFKVFKKANISSQFFGLSPLNSLYDELNSINLDTQNFNKFLENNSFFGAVIFAKDTLGLEELQILKRVEKQLVQPESRYKATVVQGVEKIEQIKQGIEHRLSIEEKQFIKDSIYQVYGVPTFFAGANKSGLGAGEQLTHRQNLKDLAITQMQKKLEELYNSWVLPIFYPEHTARAVEMQVESDSDIITRYTEGYKTGIWTAKQVKTLGYRVQEEETTEEDNFRIFPAKTQIVKEGNLTEGNSDDGLTDSVDEKIDTNTRSEDQVRIEKQAEPVKFINNLKPFHIDVEPVEFEVSQPIVNEQQAKVDKSRFTVQDLPNFSPQQKKRVFSFLDSTKAQSQEYSICDQILIGKQKEDLQKQIKTILQRQYKVDLSKKIESKASSDDELLELQNSKQDWIPIATSLAYYLNLGKEDVIRQAKEQNKTDFTQSQRASLNKSFDNYIIDRLNGLSGLDNSQSTLKQSIWQTTKDNLGSILDQISNDSNQTEGDAITDREIDTRSELIASNEALTAFGQGSAMAGIEFGAKKKQWLPSISREPRLRHAQIYGEIVDYDKPFSIGYQFPNTEIRCKCGMRVFFDNETQTKL